MHAAPGSETEERGAPALLAHFALIERVTTDAEPSGRTRLEDEVGHDLARLLVGALARAGSRARR